MIIDKHKYKEELQKLKLNNDCPQNGSEQNIEAYRFCYSDLENPDNFIPQAIKAKTPSRRLTEDGICNDYALSFFITEAAARKKFDGFEKRIKILLGYTHIGYGSIYEKDGLITPVNTDGHYNLHEYTGVDLVKKFKMIGQL